MSGMETLEKVRAFFRSCTDVQGVGSKDDPIMIVISPEALAKALGTDVLTLMLEAHGPQMRLHPELYEIPDNAEASPAQA